VLEDASSIPASATSPPSAARGPAAATSWRLPCDWITLIDDRRSAVSLPELPLLAVLPGTGGLTRLTESASPRDRADLFCTAEEGVRGQRRGRLAPGRRDRPALGLGEEDRRARGGLGGDV